MVFALVRPVSDALPRCELTHMVREPIDLAKARSQHSAYERALAMMGCTILRAAAAPTLPDAVFVEDMAVVVDEVAVMTRPGAESRRAESAGVADALRPHRELVSMESGTLDGGDVLRLGRTLYVGRSTRTDEEGIAELERLLAPHGYTIVTVPVGDCLHLKTAVTQVADGALLVQPKWLDPAIFGDQRIIDVDPAEALAANGLLLAGRLLYSSAFPLTRARLEAAGVAVWPFDQSELAKAEGALTCCSVVF